MVIKPGRIEYASQQFHVNRFKKERFSLRRVDTM